MKTRFILMIALLFSLSMFTEAQPQKGTLEIGGSGYFIQSKAKEEGQKLKIFHFSPEIQYYLLKHFAVGGALTIKGHKDYELANEDFFYAVFLSPSIEGYIVNRNFWGLSFRGTANIVAATTYNINKTISSYSIGPKVMWNITPNLSTYLWIAYRSLEDFDETMGFHSVIPSDNFDLRWGFSYYLHRKKTENN